MQYFGRQSFLTGLTTGIAITVCAGVLLAASKDNAYDENGQENARTQVVEPLFFATGDSLNATLWRRNDDGSLTCLSRNICRASYRPR